MEKKGGHPSAPARPLVFRASLYCERILGSELSSNSRRISSSERASKLGFIVHERTKEEEIPTARQLGDTAIRVAHLGATGFACVVALLNRLDTLGDDRLAGSLLYTLRHAHQHLAGGEIDAGDRGEDAQSEPGVFRVELPQQPE